MNTLHDIESTEDIQLLVNRFYDKVKKDDLIAFFFTQTVIVNWEKHLPVMYDFWESVIFGKPGYTGNPMRAHIALNSKSKMEPVHFKRWIELFTQTVDELFRGPTADFTRQRAASIASVMQAKVSQHAA